MAEGIFKKLIGRKIFVQSAGIFDTLEIDGFTVKVCNEINVQLSKHRVRSLKEMERGRLYLIIIPLTQSLLKYKYSTYSSNNRGLFVDEPIKDEKDINLTISFTEKQGILFLKKSISDFQIILHKKTLFFIKNIYNNKKNWSFYGKEKCRVSGLVKEAQQI